MARVTYVKSARASKKERTCGACHKPVTAGQSYRWAAPGGIGARKLFRHAIDECNKQFRRSELSSSKMGAVWDAQDDAESNLGALSVDDFISDGEFDSSGFDNAVQEILQEAASAAEECASDYQDGIDSMPDALQDGPTAEESREKIDALEQWQQELESWSTSETFEPPERDEVDEPNDDTDEDREAEWLDTLRGAAEEYAENVIAEAIEALSELGY